MSLLWWLPALSGPQGAPPPPGSSRLPLQGFHEGAIYYVTLDGFSPNPVLPGVPLFRRLLHTRVGSRSGGEQL